MANTWPVLLPEFSIVENYSETPEDAQLRSQMEEGPDKVRQNPNPKPGMIRFQKLLTKTETKTLDDFWRLTLAKGVLTFQEYHPRTDQLVTFRFVSRPTYSHRGGLFFMANMELEILPI